MALREFVLPPGGTGAMRASVLHPIRSRTARAVTAQAITAACRVFVQVLYAFCPPALESLRSLSWQCSRRSFTAQAWATPSECRLPPAAAAARPQQAARPPFRAAFSSAAARHAAAFCVRRHPECVR